MILHGQVVEQSVDHEDRATFVKEYVLASGSMPIAMVRKRLARAPTPPGGDLDAAAAPTRAPVLLLHGYAQNRYAFHLPSRSLANHLARAGFDVFNADLRGRGRSAHLGASRPGDVRDFVTEDVPAALDSIARLSGPRPVFLVGHSLGGVVSYCVACDRPQRVAGVVSFGSPYHFTLGSRWLGVLARAFMALDRRFGLPNLPVPAHAYGSFVRTARALVESPVHPLPLRGFHRGSMEPDVLDEHMRLAMDRGSISTMRGMFEWAGEIRARRHEGDRGLFGYAARFEALDVPLLVIAGEHDDLAPPESVRPAFERSRSSDKTYRAFPFGHVDMLVGRDAPRLTWPLVTSWLLQRSAPGSAHAAA